MKIISLYPSNDVYQVVSEDEQTIYFQGSKEDCMRYYLKQELIKNGIIKQQEQ
jgi:hypothetical protein